MTKRPLLLFLSLGALLLASEAIRLAWYSIGEPPWRGDPVLTFSIPKDVEVFDLSGSRAAEILSYDGAAVVRWDGEGRSSAEVEVIHLEYEEGNARVWVDLFTHSPEVCLGSSGSTLLQTYDNRIVNIEGRDLVFRHLLFQQPLAAEPVHVFKMIWLPDMEKLGIRGDDDSFRQGRLIAARSRFIPPGTLTLAIVSGVEGPEEAWSALREKVRRAYRFE